MTDLTSFDARAVEIQRDLAKAIAIREGRDWSHLRSRHECESEASDMIAAWARSPRDPQDVLERLCQAHLENATERHRYRAELRAQRATLDDRKAPEPDPTKAVVFVRDELSRRLVKLTLPVEQVEIVR